MFLLKQEYKTNEFGLFQFSISAVQIRENSCCPKKCWNDLMSFVYFNILIFGIILTITY